MPSARGTTGRKALPAPVRVGTGGAPGVLSGVPSKPQPGHLLTCWAREWDSHLFLNLKPAS